MRRDVKPTIIWEGQVRKSNEVDEMGTRAGRVVVIAAPNTYSRRTLTYSLVYEYSEETDALGLKIWCRCAYPFEEFMDVVADLFLKQKGEQP